MEKAIIDAAVVICVRNSPTGKQVLLVQRALHLNSHAGEVALPGGKWEIGDADLAATARREAFEEVGLKATDIATLQAMPSRFTRQGIRVTPFVAELSVASGCELQLVACMQELQALFWMPLDIVLADQRERTDIFERAGKEYWAPLYRFDGYCVWGFTARLLVDYVNCYGGGRHYS
ncbi:MAG: CoA pyrophosphatase [Marinagarivorans sp.]|nr:CoA pyrophosphatase [Marinagarivorans sp.]